jgi:hypothetical protein
MLIKSMAASITALLALSLAVPANAAAIIDTNKDPIVVRQLDENQRQNKEWTLPEKCNDKQAKILFKAGFNRPGMLRGAWAITWRESKHQSLDESSRWFTGALGTWQIQTSAWSGRSWWSRDNMLDKRKQSEIVRKHFLKDGMHNWGYGYSFKNDSWYENAGMYYSLWGSSRTYAWVIAPFNTGWSLFPGKCTPVKK